MNAHLQATQANSHAVIWMPCSLLARTATFNHAALLPPAATCPVAPLVQVQPAPDCRESALMGLALAPLLVATVLMITLSAVVFFVLQRRPQAHACVVL